MDKLLNDKEVLKIIGGNAKIITYPELEKYNSISHLFGKKDKVILLYVNEIDDDGMTGHWCLLTKVKRNGKTIIEFLDPYGMMPDDQLKFYTDCWRQESGQDENFLTRLLYDFSLNNKHEIHYNELPFQTDSKKINTCGRHIGLRGHFYKIPLTKYQNILHNMEKKGYDLDKVVVKLTEEMLE